jgi:hypothetical protein
MKLFRKFLRFWITLATTGGFLAGWALLAHAPKPIQSTAPSGSATTAIPTLAPLPPLNLSGTSGDNNFQQPQFSVQQNQSSFSQAPMFRTGGS